jgi:hypothetical protein
MNESTGEVERDKPSLVSEASGRDEVVFLLKNMLLIRWKVGIVAGRMFAREGVRGRLMAVRNVLRALR